MTLKEAQMICTNIDARYNTMSKTICWTDVYRNEEELIEDLVRVGNPKDAKAYGLYRGYEYIHSFARFVSNGWDLTLSQYRQAKRFALEIKKAAAVAEFTNA